jgi:hypothetical protein
MKEAFDKVLSWYDFLIGWRPSRWASLPPEAFLSSQDLREVALAKERDLHAKAQYRSQITLAIATVLVGFVAAAIACVSIFVSTHRPATPDLPLGATQEAKDGAVADKTIPLCGSQIWSIDLRQPDYPKDIHHREKFFSAEVLDGKTNKELWPGFVSQGGGFEIVTTSKRIIMPCRTK